MPAQIFGAQAAVTTLNRAFTNSSPANAVYLNQVANAGADVSATNAGNVLAYGTFANTFAAPYQSMAFADIATLLLTNMGITGDAQAQTFVVAFLTQMGKPNLGMSVLLLSAYLSSLEGDATYSTAAKAWNAELTSGFSYSSNASNTTPQIGDVAAPPANQGQTFTLTTGVDTGAGFTGGAGNDTFNAADSAIAGSNTVGKTFTSLDSLNGGAGTDTLNITQTAAMPLVASVTVQNIEVANLTSAAAIGAQATPFDTTGWTGLTNLNVNKAVYAGAGDGAFLKAATTTDVTVADATGAIEVTGGKSVTITNKMNDANQSVLVNGAGDVTVTASDSAAAAGAIKIGTGTAVTGAVKVTSTGAKFASTNGNVAMDDITVNGGTTVSVTQVATSDASAAATKATANDKITQGAVTVTGGNTTTTVSVVQADQATPVAAQAAVTAVPATKTVTFVAMAANDWVSIDGLKFTATKALTAAEAAAAFAGLTATATVAEVQGQGFSSNGYYTSTTATASWTSGAVSGNTVTFSQTVAGAVGLTLNQNLATGTVTEATGTTGVLAVAAVTGVAAVANGAVVIDDNAVKSITTVTVDGYSAGATLGGANGNGSKELNALTTLTLANSGAGAANVNSSATTLALTLNDVIGAVSLDVGGATLKTLNITGATKASTTALTAAAVETLTVAGTQVVSLTNDLDALKTVTVSGTAGLTLAAATANTITSVNTSATTGKVTTTIDTTKATYTGGAGVDNVTTDNTTAATKAIALGEGDDTLTFKSGSQNTSTVTLDGGAGTDTVKMDSADAAAVTGGPAFAGKLTGFEKLSLGVTAANGTDTVNLANMNNTNYVISAGTSAGVGGTKEVTTATFTALNTGASVTIDGKTVTATQYLTAANVADAMSGTTVTGANVTGAFTNWAVKSHTAGATTTVFEAVAVGNPANLTATSAQGAVSTTPVAVTTTQGVAVTTESATVSFGSLSTGETVTVGGRTVTTAAQNTESVNIAWGAGAIAGGATITFAGLTLTAAGGGGTAADIITALQTGASAGTITVTGTLTAGWTPSVVNATTARYTSTTANTNVTDLVTTLGGTVGGAATVSNYVQGFNGTLTAAQVRDAVNDAATSGTGWTAGAGLPTGGGAYTLDTTGLNTNQLKFTNTVAGTIADISVVSTGNQPTVAISQGVNAVAEVATVTFQALKSGQVVTVAGRTVTASNADLTAAQVEAAFLAGADIGSATVGGALDIANWTVAESGAPGDGVLKFTSAVAGNPADFSAVAVTNAAAPATGIFSGTTDGTAVVTTIGTLALTNMANNGTLELTGANAGLVTVALTDATGTSDVLNVVTKVDASDLAFGTVSAAGVETINVTATDITPTNTTVGHVDFGKATISSQTLTLKDAALKTVVVTGNANLTLTNDAINVAVTSVDASALTGKFTAATNGTVAQTIKGSLTAANTLTASTSNLADTLIGGAAADTFNTNAGLTTVTGGAGADTFNIAAASVNVNSYSTIADAATGDIIKFAGANKFAASKVALDATAVFQDYANAAMNLTAVNELSWFQYGGNTYVVMDAGADSTTFVNGSDMIVKLTGVVNLANASFSATQGTIELG